MIVHEYFPQVLLIELRSFQYTQKANERSNKCEEESEGNAEWGESDEYKLEDCLDWVGYVDQRKPGFAHLLKIKL